MGLYDLKELEPAVGVPSIIVILVHGTFAPNAPWTRADSVFHRALMNGLHTNPLILSFTWSGSNSARKREIAASELRDHLVKSAESYQGVPHVIVGHSHGGNVALRAISGTPILSSFRVVCLSTPIINAIPRARSDKGEARKMMIAATILLFFQIDALCVWAGAYPTDSGTVYLFGPITGSLLLAALYAPVAYLLFRALKAHLNWSLSFCDWTIVAEGLKPTSALFLRYPGDEATLALGAFQAFQYLMNRVAQAIAALIKSLLIAARWLLKKFTGWFLLGVGFLSVVLISIVLCVAAVYLLSPYAPGWIVPLILVLLVLLAIGLVIVWPLSVFVCFGLAAFLSGLALSTLIAVLAPLLMLTATLPFGWGLGIASLWIELTVEAAPMGTWNVVTLQPTVKNATLRHSLGYAEEAALAQLISFMRNITKS